MSQFFLCFNYLSFLEVEPCIPLLHHDLKVTMCTNIDTYFWLSNNLVKAKKLMEQHAYIYALKFDVSKFVLWSSLLASD
jgi:hypothetical protein